LGLSQRFNKCLSDPSGKGQLEVRPLPQRTILEENMPTDVRDLQELKNEDLERHEQPKLPEDEDSDPVGKPPKVQEVEDTARQMNEPAQEPIDRTADLLLSENELSKRGITTPAESERPAR
jgi:hypothetical protein